jgi:hypothetical protein
MHPWISDEFLKALLIGKVHYNSLDDIPRLPSALLEGSFYPEDDMLNSARSAHAAISMDVMESDRLGHLLKGALDAIERRKQAMVKIEAEYRVLNSHIWKVPDDALGQIFAACMPGDLSNQRSVSFPTLMLVCRRWRNVLYATPQCWTYFNIGFHRIQDGLIGHIERGGTLPLSLNFGYTDSNKDIPIQALRKLVAHFPSKLSALSVSMNVTLEQSHSWIFMHLFKQAMPNLTDLELPGNRLGYWKHSWDLTPGVRRLSIQLPYRCTGVVHQLESLTIELDKSSNQFLFETLMFFCNTPEVFIIGLEDPGYFSNPFPVPLQKLHLQWGPDADEYCIEAFFYCIECKGITGLTSISSEYQSLGLWSERKISLTALNIFLERSGTAQLLNLDLSGFIFSTGQHFITLLGLLSSITRLKLTFHPSRDWTSAFPALTWGKTTHFLPSLAEVNFDIGSEDAPLMEELLRSREHSLTNIVLQVWCALPSKPRTRVGSMKSKFSPTRWGLRRMQISIVEQSNRMVLAK